LFRSTDSGLSWTQVYTLGQVVEVVSSTLIYAAGMIPSDLAGCFFGNYSFARSADGGATWDVYPVGCLTMLSFIMTEPGNPDVIYMGGSYDPINYSCGLWVSRDRGQTWSMIFPPELGFGGGPPISLAIDPLDAQHLYLTNQTGLFTSQDSGQAWQQILVPVHVGHLIIDGKLLYITPAWTDGGPILRSDDGGATWWQSTFKLPAQATVFQAAPGHPGRLYIGLSNYGIWRSDSRGGSWVEVNNGIRLPAKIQTLAIDPSIPQHLFAGASEVRNGLFESEDDGLSWKTVITDTAIQVVAIQPISPTVVFAGTLDGLYMSDPSKENSWTKVFTGLDIEDISFSHHNPSRVIVGGYDPRMRLGFVLQYRFIGYTWAWYFGNIPESGVVTAVASDPRNPERMYAGSGYHPGLFYSGPGKIWRSDDGGNNWQLLWTKNAMVIDLLVDPYRPGWVYASTQSGMYLSQDDGKSWTLHNSTIQFKYLQTIALAIDDIGVLYATSENYGVYYWDSSQDIWKPIGSLYNWMNTLVFRPGEPRNLLAGGESGLWRLDLLAMLKIFLPHLYR